MNAGQNIMETGGGMGGNASYKNLIPKKYGTIDSSPNYGMRGGGESVKEFDYGIKNEASKLGGSISRLGKNGSDIMVKSNFNAQEFTTP